MEKIKIIVPRIIYGLLAICIALWLGGKVNRPKKGSVLNPVSQEKGKVLNGEFSAAALSKALVPKLAASSSGMSNLLIGAVVVVALFFQMCCVAKPAVRSVEKYRCASPCSSTNKNLTDELLDAAFKGNLDCVKHLVQQGADVDDTDSKGHTALMWAAEGGVLGCVKYLVQQGADIHAMDKDGDTALQWAMQYNDEAHLDVAAYLFLKQDRN